MNTKSVIALALSIFLFGACKVNYTSKDYIKAVLKNLDNIESATYYLKGENWAPGDTTASDINYSYVKEYDNPSDTTIGSKFVHLNQNNPAQLEFCYDGHMRAVVYNDEKMVVLDSFTVRPLPFRPLTPPFFNYAKNILRYALETTDSISLDFADLKDSIYVKLTIHEDSQIEFFGKAYHMPPSPYTYGNNTSIYELWINKSDNLPYKVRREMSHNISVTICKDYELNKMDIRDFKAADYFPAGYKIQSYRMGGGRSKVHELLGKTAPEWTLPSAGDMQIALSDLKSKVLLIQFTSVSCGPCKASIPFLKKLGSEYKKADFDFVAIESTSRNLDVLKNYMNRNKFDYKYLLGTKEVLKSYSITAFPVFFILNENREVKKVVVGYGEGTTDMEIRKVINDMVIVKI